MTTRQWELYKLLRAQPDKWFSQKEICEHVEGYTYIERNNDCCPAIRNDKLAINASSEIDKIVVMKNYQFKIATYEEYFEERRKHISRLKNQVKELQNIDYKYHMNGQGKLLSNQGVEIDGKSKARRFFETFVNEEY